MKFNTLFIYLLLYSNSKLLEMQDLVDDQAGNVPWSTEMLDSQETADFLALKSQEDMGKMSRSRSQEGRRSSASNRYTSYSSDEDSEFLFDISYNYVGVILMLYFTDKGGK